MARLPVPGGDNDVWGTILNQYLLVAHNADGTLKSTGVANVASQAKVDTLTAATTPTVPDATSSTKGILRLSGDLSGTANTPTVPGLAGKEPKISTGSTGQYWRGDKTWQSLNKSAVGLGSADNTSDANKPVSTATQNALNAKATDAAVVHLTGTETITGAKTFVVSPIVPTPTASGAAATKAYVDGVAGAGAPDATSSSKGILQLGGDLGGTASSPTVPGLAGKEPTISGGSTAQYWRGDKSWQTLDNTTVGLGNVDNTSDANKPVSTATQTALNSKFSSATLTTKGDLAVATAPGVIGRVGVGTNNQVLMADSAQTSGLKWSSASDSTAVHKGDFVLNVKDYGALGDDTTDDTTAIQTAINDAQPGMTVFLPLGKYRTNAPLTLHPGVTLQGSHGNHIDNGGYVQTVTYIKPLATFSGAACIQMVDKEIGGYANNSCEQRIYDLTLDGGALSGTTIDGIQANGLVHGVIIRDVAIRFFPNRGIATVYYTRADTSIVNSYSWRIQRVMSDTNGGYGYVFLSLTDATLIDLEAIGNDKSGYYIATAANSHFIGCRAEWNGFSGYQIDASGSFGTSIFTSCSTDRNSQHGVYVTGTGTQPILFNGLMLKRDGRNGGSGGGGYAGFAVNTVTAPIIVNGITVSCGVDDGGSGVNSPQYGFSATSASYVSVASGFFHGATAGWFDGGGNTIVRRGPNVGERTGTWNSPTNVYRNNWGTDSGSTFTAAMNVTDATAIAITNTNANNNAPLQSMITTATGDRLLSSRTSADTTYRYNIQTGGLQEWGSGTASRDTNLYRSGVAALKTDGLFTGQSLTSSGLTGATSASRYVGATAAGAPASGTFAVGDFIIDRSGGIWVCTTAGSPGTWTAVRATPITSNTQTSNYTLALGDAGAVVEMNSASAITLTIPTNASVNFAIGTIIDLFQLGAGGLTVAGPSVTLRYLSTLNATGQYAAIRLRKRATDEWAVSGDLA